MQAFLSVPLVSTPAHPLASGGRDGDSGRMTSSTIFRGGHTSEASDLVAPAGAGVSRPGSDGPGSRAEREPHWWQRLRRVLSPQQPPHELQQAVLERMLALLESARAEVSAGWVQGGWWTTSAGGNRQALVRRLGDGPSDPHAVGAVCLVGALIRAGSRQGRDPEVGRAIDAVYDALWESRGQPAATPGRGPIMVSSPQVRLAKVQWLTRWNDAPGRSTEEVLDILDRAIAGTVQNLAILPAPRPPVSV